MPPPLTFESNLDCWSALTTQNGFLFGKVFGFIMGGQPDNLHLFSKKSSETALRWTTSWTALMVYVKFIFFVYYMKLNCVWTNISLFSCNCAVSSKWPFSSVWWGGFHSYLNFIKQSQFWLQSPLGIHMKVTVVDSSVAYKSVETSWVPIP